jgi:hypothetical protein
VVIVDVFPDVAWEAVDNCRTDDIVCRVPACEARVGWKHVCWFHWGGVKVKESFGCAVPFSDTPDGWGIFGVETSNSVSSRSNTGGDGDATAMEF